jgi:UDPglucose 6-dehydrogenase
VDVLIIVTEWEQSRALDLDRLKRTMAGTVIVDFKNVYRPEALAKARFRYQGVGRPGA